MDIWIYGYMDIWIFGYLDIWIYGWIKTMVGSSCGGDGCRPPHPRIYEGLRPSNSPSISWIHPTPPSSPDMTLAGYVGEKMTFDAYTYIHSIHRMLK